MADTSYFQVAVALLRPEDLDAIDGLPRGPRREFLRRLGRHLGARGETPEEFLQHLPRLRIGQWSQGLPRQSLADVLIKPTIDQFLAEMREEAEDPPLDTLRRATIRVSENTNERLVRLALAWCIAQEQPVAPHAEVLLNDPALFGGSGAASGPRVWRPLDQPAAQDAGSAAEDPAAPSDEPSAVPSPAGAPDAPPTLLDVEASWVRAKGSAARLAEAIELGLAPGRDELTDIRGFAEALERAEEALTDAGFAPKGRTVADLTASDQARLAHLEELERLEREQIHRGARLEEVLTRVRALRVLRSHDPSDIHHLEDLRLLIDGVEKQLLGTPGTADAIIAEAEAPDADSSLAWLLALERFVALSDGSADRTELREAAQRLMGAPNPVSALHLAVTYGSCGPDPSDATPGSDTASTDSSDLTVTTSNEREIPSGSTLAVDAPSAESQGPDPGGEKVDPDETADRPAEPTVEEGEEVEEGEVSPTSAEVVADDGGVPPDASTVQVANMPDAPAPSAMVASEANAGTEPTAGAPPRKVDDVLADLIADDRLGLAAWLAEADGRPTAAAVYRALALAAALDPALTDVANAFEEQVRKIDDAVLADQLDLQVLALLACATTGFRYPQLLPWHMLSSVEAVLGGEEAVASLATILRMVAELGALPTDTFADVDERRLDLDRQIETTVVEATDLLETGPHRRILYAPATDTWRELINPESDHGEIGRLVQPVALDDREKVEWVRQEADRLNGDQEIDRLIDTTASDLGFRTTIEARARARLRQHVNHALGLARRWASLIDRSSSLEPKATQPEGRRAEKVREDLSAARPRLEALAAAWGSSTDRLVAVAGVRLEQAIHHLAQLASDGESIAAGAQDIDTLLNAELLRLPSVPMSELRPRELPSIEVLLNDVKAHRDWQTAFEDRLTNRNISACRAIVTILQASEPELAERLDAELDARASALRWELDGRMATTECSIGLAMADGLLAEDRAAALQAQLVSLDVAAEVPDQDEIAATLDEIDQSLLLLAREARSDRLERLDGLVASGLDPEAPAVGRVRAVLDEGGSTAVADDFLSHLERGEALPEPEASASAFDRFFPAASDRLTGVDLASVVGGALQLPDLDFTGLPRQRLNQTERGWEAWEALGHSTPDAAELRVVLRELGFGQVSPSTTRNTPAPDRHWFDVDLASGTLQGRVFVPDFGSAANGRYRILIVQDQPTPTRLMSYLKADDSVLPIVVVYRGVLSPDSRRDFAEQLRRSSDRRSVIVVDDAAYLYALRHGDRVITTLMECTLPFTAVNPYTPYVAGQVPEEMFYGRSEERRSLLDPLGPAFVYGGRQLGKSALLREVARRAARQSSRAIYLDLAYEGIGTFRQAEELWQLLSQRLAAEGIGNATKLRTSDAFEDVRNQIEGWLEQHPHVRLYVLLDECDNLLDDDVKRRFSVTQRLRGLMDSNRGRLKFILAGLHVVQRFEQIPNQPLAHVASGKVVVGPLAPSDSAELVRTPLSALGFRFEDPNLAYRISAYANNQASILQLVADRLVRRMLERPRTADAPPSAITARDLSETLADRQLHEDIRQRFEWTIDLDRRYRVVALVIAEHAHAVGATEPMDASQLRRECLRAWPAGFEGIEAEAFNAVLKEMEGLGVLRRVVGGGWGLRTPSLLRLLGNHYDILEAIGGLASLPLDDSTFVPVNAHRALEGDGLPSPINEEQVRRITDGQQPFLVAGSTATGIDDVPRALRQIAEEQGMAWTHATGQMSALRSALRRAADSSTVAVRLVAVDLRSVAVEDRADSVAELTAALAGEAGVRLLFLTDHPTSALIEGFPLESRIMLARWGRAPLEHWLRDANIHLTKPDIEEILELSGGWRLVLARWHQHLAECASPGEAIAATRAWLRGSDGAQALWEASGVPALLDAVAGWRALGAWDELSSDDWADGLEAIGCSESSPGAAEVVLRALGALVEASGSSGRIALRQEPVLRSAFDVVGADGP